MKCSWLSCLALGGVLLATVGCTHVDVTSGAGSNHVVTGIVKCPTRLVAPPDSEVAVRIVGGAGAAASIGAGNDLIVDRHEGGAAGAVIAEQTIHAPWTMPVPFQIEFRADEVRLRQGLNLEARISWGGRVRYRSVESQVITPANLDKPYTLWVEPVE